MADWECGPPAFDLARLERKLEVLAEVRAVAPRLLTLEQAGAYLGRTRRAVEAMVARRELPLVRARAGGRRHLDVRDLDGWIGRNKR
jgi:excisionase family DNA binding protein